MANISDFPDLDHLEQVIAQFYKNGIDVAIDRNERFADQIRTFKLNEILVLSSWANDNATKSESRLTLGFIIDIPDELRPEPEGSAFNPVQNDRYNEALKRFIDTLNDGGITDDLFNEWFDGFLVNANFAEVREDWIIFSLKRTDSAQAYSLTNDTLIRPTSIPSDTPGDAPETTIDERAAGIREEIDEPEEVAEEQLEIVPENDILSYPEREDLRSALEIAFKEALIDSQFFEEDQFLIDRIVVDEPWGNGRADLGEDPISFIYYVEPEGIFDQLQVQARLDGEIIDDERDGAIAENFDISELMDTWFDGFIFEVVNESIFTQFDNRLRQVNKQRLYDIYNNTILRLSDGNLIEDDFEEPEEPEKEPEIIEEGVETVEEREIEEQVEEQVEEQAEEEPEPELTPEFPEIPNELRPFAADEDRLEIPNGKETKSVEPRPVYDFEMELAAPGGNIDCGIGWAKRQEGENTFAQGIPPGTFPRTGCYIRSYLLNRGPSYVLEMYNDLLVYSAYISTLHGGNFKPGTYQSFRVFINKLLLVGERDGPELIRRLSPQQASARGLEQRPDHPTRDNEKADYLENRNYYEIIEENADSDIWLNITTFLRQARAD